MINVINMTSSPPRRRGRTVCVSLAAATLLLATGCSGAAAGAAAGSTAAKTYASTGFVQPFSATLPAWTSNTTPTTAITHRLITWEQTPCTSACTDGTDAKLRVLAPQSVVEPSADASVPVPDYAGYLTYLHSLEESGAILVSDSATDTIDGHRATVLTVVTPSTMEGAIACELPAPATNGCWGFVAGFRLRLAVIDVGRNPLLVWARTNATSPQAASSDNDLNVMLASMSFHPAPQSSSPGATDTGLEGTWRTSFTRADAVRVLTRAGLAEAAGTVLSDFPESSGPVRWELRIGGGSYGIWMINADGTAKAEDGQAYQLDGTTLTADPTNANGTRTVYSITRTGSTMTWTFVSDVSPPLAPGVPDEAIQRVLYTTGTWKQVS